jgi:hypothetical protein
MKDFTRFTIPMLRQRISTLPYAPDAERNWCITISHLEPASIAQPGVSGQASVVRLERIQRIPQDTRKVRVPLRILPRERTRRPLGYVIHQQVLT